MTYQIDQSGRVENTSKPTVVAFSNSKNKSIYISAVEKRKVHLLFRTAKRPGIFAYKTFAILIYLLIKNHLREIKTLTIDKEYYGKEALIKKYIIELIRKGGQKYDPSNIHFSEIGKHSNAHKEAITVFRKKKKPQLVAEYKDLLEWII